MGLELRNKLCNWCLRSRESRQVGKRKTLKLSHLSMIEENEMQIKSPGWHQYLRAPLLESQKFNCNNMACFDLQKSTPHKYLEKSFQNKNIIVPNVLSLLSNREEGSKRGGCSMKLSAIPDIPEGTGLPVNLSILWAPPL